MKPRSPSQRRTRRLKAQAAGSYEARFDAYRLLPLPLRLGDAVAVAAGFALLVFPWSGNFDPGGHLLGGPLLLFALADESERPLGGTAAALLLPLMTVWVVHPSRWTLAASLCGWCGWIGFALYLTYLVAA